MRGYSGADPGADLDDEPTEEELYAATVAAELAAVSADDDA